MHKKENRDSHVASAACSRAAVIPRLLAMYGTAALPASPVAKRKTTLACRRRRGVSCVQLCATMKLLMFMCEQQNCTKL